MFVTLPVPPRLEHRQYHHQQHMNNSKNSDRGNSSQPRRPIHQVSAHRPLELTRMAVHDACGSEMADALREYRTWTARNRTRGDGGREKRRSGTAPHAALTPSNMPTVMSAGGGGKRSRADASQERVAELQRTPTGWRMLRWVMMKRQAELKSQAMEAEAMFAEEREQRLKERCGQQIRPGRKLHSSWAPPDFPLGFFEEMSKLLEYQKANCRVLAHHGEAAKGGYCLVPGS